MPKTTLHEYDRPFKKMLGGYIACSRCYVKVAYWLQKGGSYQRYFCHDCVKHTAAWKRQQAATAEGGDDA